MTPAELMEPCLCTLNIPNIAITIIPVANVRNCIPTPVNRRNELEILMGAVGPLPQIYHIYSIIRTDVVPSKQSRKP